MEHLLPKKTNGENKATPYIGRYVTIYIPCGRVQGKITETNYDRTLLLPSIAWEPVNKEKSEPYIETETPTTVDTQSIQIINPLRGHESLEKLLLEPQKEKPKENDSTNM